MREGGGGGGWKREMISSQQSFSAAYTIGSSDSIHILIRAQGKHFFLSTTVRRKRTTHRAIGLSRCGGNTQEIQCQLCELLVRVQSVELSRYPGRTPMLLPHTPPTCCLSPRQTEVQRPSWRRDRHLCPISSGCNSRKESAFAVQGKNTYPRPAFLPTGARVRL